MSVHYVASFALMMVRNANRHTFQFNEHCSSYYNMITPHHHLLAYYINNILCAHIIQLFVVGKTVAFVKCWASYILLKLQCHLS